MTIPFNGNLFSPKINLIFLLNWLIFENIMNDKNYAPYKILLKLKGRP